MGLFKTIRNALSAGSAREIPAQADEPTGPAKVTSRADAKSPAAETTGRPPEAANRPEAPNPPPSEAVSTAPPEVRLIRKRLLFVESDHPTLHELGRLLEPMRAAWDMVFTMNASGALEMMGQSPFDAVIAGLNLSGLSGTAFLNQVARKHPKTLRFLRCTPQERRQIKDFSDIPPQHFSTELDAEGAANVVKRAFRIDDWMGNEAIRSLLARLHKLPTLPALYTQVMNELQSPNASLEFVAKLIAKDPVMTAKMLQLVNSAYFALPREIVDPVEAVMHLGAERTKSLILLAKVFSQFDKTQCAGFDPEALWRHLMAVGAFARIVCLTESKETKIADLAFTAGLLHDIGKLLLAANLPADYSRALEQAQRRHVPVRDVEFEAFGTTHAELGACLLGTWGLPLAILEAVAWHNRPIFSEDRAFSIVTAVHVANAIEHEKTAEAADILVSQIDAGYVQRLGLSSRRNRWREACGRPTKMQDEAAEKKA
jgi:HD-like signal output (HDOD) protein